MTNDTYIYTVTSRNQATGKEHSVEVGTGEVIHLRVYARRPWWHRIAAWINQ